jgi:hypothetical protein
MKFFVGEELILLLVCLCMLSRMVYLLIWAVFVPSKAHVSRIRFGFQHLRMELESKAIWIRKWDQAEPPPQESLTAGT